jgi:hypothetical protein
MFQSPRRPPKVPPLRPSGNDPGKGYTTAPSACEPHRAWIERQAGLGRNATAIYQELVDQYGVAHGYNSVKRFCRRLRNYRAQAVRPAGVPPWRGGAGRLWRRRPDPVRIRRPLPAASPVRHDTAPLTPLVPQGRVEVQYRGVGLAPRRGVSLLWRLPAALCSSF